MIGQKPPALQTPRLTLRPITEAEGDAVAKILTSPAVYETYMVPNPHDPEAVARVVAAFCRLSAAADRFVYGIFDGDRLLGLINEVEEGEGAMELGFALHPHAWGRGYATEALTAAMTALFEAGYATVKTGAFEENAASIRVMEKCGMTRLSETEEIVYRGKNRRCILFEKFAPQSTKHTEGDCPL